MVQEGVGGEAGWGGRRRGRRRGGRKALPSRYISASAMSLIILCASPCTTAAVQGLTLVHFSAQLERFASDRGCA